MWILLHIYVLHYKAKEKLKLIMKRATDELIYINSGMIDQYNRQTNRDIYGQTVNKYLHFFTYHQLKSGHSIALFAHDRGSTEEKMKTYIQGLKQWPAKGHFMFGGQK